MNPHLARLAAALLALGAACASRPSRPTGAPPSGGAPTAVGPERGADVEQPAAPSPEPSAAPGGAAAGEAAAGEAAAGSEAPPLDPAALREAVAAAAPDGPGPRGARAVRALQLVADALDALARSARAREAVGALREAAAAVGRLERTDLDRADRLKIALARGVDALRAAGGEAHRDALGPWLQAAGAAVDQIDPATPLGLQRAVAQDALRALADAVLRAHELDAGAG